MNNRKKIIRLILEIVVVSAMGFVLYKMFRDSYKDIGKQLVKTNIAILVGMLVLGNIYYFIDAMMYWYLLRKEGYEVSFRRCLSIGYMCVFFNVTTFGAGIKPAQVMFLHTKGVDVGKAISITTMPYVFHKSTIVVYAIIMIIANINFVKASFPSSLIYIYLGIALSLVVIIGMILIGASVKFHRLLFKLIDFLLKKEKYKALNSGIKEQMDNLRIATKDIVRDPKAWLRFTVTNVVKMSSWYVIPVIAIFATGGEMDGVTIAQAITATAIMQLIMGVIPTSGGVGSLEVVFSLIFAAVFGTALAGSSMILYRIATYYFPFIISVFIMISAGRDMKHGEIPKHNKK